VSDQDYGAMTEEQQSAVALAVYQLTPEQMVKVLYAISHALYRHYGVRVVVTEAGVAIRE